MWKDDSSLGIGSEWGFPFSLFFFFFRWPVRLTGPPFGPGRPKNVPVPGQNRTTVIEVEHGCGRVYYVIPWLFGNKQLLAPCQNTCCRFLLDFLTNRLFFRTTVLRLTGFAILSEGRERIAYEGSVFLGFLTVGNGSIILAFRVFFLPLSAPIVCDDDHPVSTIDFSFRPLSTYTIHISRCVSYTIQYIAELRCTSQGLSLSRSGSVRLPRLHNKPVVLRTERQAGFRFCFYS